MLIGNGYTSEKFLEVCCSDEHLEGGGSREDEEMSVYIFTSSTTAPMKSDVRVTADSLAKEKRMGALHESTKILLGPLQGCELKGTFVKTRELVEWKCVPLLVTYYWDTFKGEDMSHATQCCCEETKCWVYRDWKRYH